jgi:chemotaxis protein methyltransferase CheR
MIQNVKSAERTEIFAWSIGSCSGEEPSSLNLIWKLGLKKAQKKNLELKIFATDYHSVMIQRAKAARYTAGSLRYLPEEYINLAFSKKDKEYQLRPQFRENIIFKQQDIRTEWPPGNFDLILCRNLVFTYFRENLQTKILNKLLGKLENRGYLIIGNHEKLPVELPNLRPLPESKLIFQKIASEA